MDKALHAVEFDGTTFGMTVEASSMSYKLFKKQIVEEDAIDVCGNAFRVLAVSAVWLGTIMGIAHWKVTEAKHIDYFVIDGLRNDRKIYVKYDDDVIDYRVRRQKYHRHN